MRYGIKKITVVKKQKRQVDLRAKRREQTALTPFTAVQTYHYTQEKIKLDDLFAVGELPMVKPKKAKRPSFIKSVKRIFHGSYARVRAVWKWLSARSKKKTDDKKWVSFLSGALCGTLCVAIVSAFSVLLLLFGGYLLPYEELTVPALVGKDYTSAADLIDSRFDVELTYKSSEDAANGQILSQTPSAGTIRKYYARGEKCKLSLTVSTGRSYYTVAPLSGTDARDAILLLRNEGVAISTVYEHSTSVPSGTVISTSPSVGGTVFEGERLVLRISLGKEPQLVSVPDLYSLTEAQARELLASKDLVLGEVTYKESSQTQGRIIAQQYSPYSKIEKGSTVSVTVSLGSGYSQKTAPDLYGLTVDEARERLAQYGLVLGSVYSLSSGAPKGTVVAQTPIAGTPITSTINSIDIFISS